MEPLRKQTEDQRRGAVDEDADPLLHGGAISGHPQCCRDPGGVDHQAAHADDDMEQVPLEQIVHQMDMV